MKQPPFQSLNQLADWLDSVATQLEDLTSEPQMDTDTPTNIDIPTPSMSPIETLITQRINSHISAGTFPTAEEAQAIYTLDQISRHYNA